MEDIFTHKKPLADRIRPKVLDEFLGQEHLIGNNGPIRKIIESKEVPSMIFWGPPGSGKTTLAKIIGKLDGYKFVGFSAVAAGVDDVRRIIKQAQIYKIEGKRTILFIDEIHRFNKAQQAAFLPYVEDGTIILIATTTENPSFEVISPLISRTVVYMFYKLKEADIIKIIDRALNTKEGLTNYNVKIDEEGKKFLSQIADGDARISLNILEFAVLTTKPINGIREITISALKEAVDKCPLLYDKKGEEHYNLISALIKSLRGSDVDASIYWLGRMIEAGEDPLYIARRLVIFASEDIGNADPNALVLATACKEAVEFVGLPECFLNLSQTVIYLAAAPKSNTTLIAYNKALEDIKNYGALPVPLHLRNPVTKLMENFGYGKDYKYPHKYEKHWVKETYLPKELKNKKYFYPSDIGFEKKIKERLNHIKNENS